MSRLPGGASPTAPSRRCCWDEIDDDDIGLEHHDVIKRPRHLIARRDDKLFPLEQRLDKLPEIPRHIHRKDVLAIRLCLFHLEATLKDIRTHSALPRTRSVQCTRAVNAVRTIGSHHDGGVMELCHEYFVIPATFRVQKS